MTDLDDDDSSWVAFWLAMLLTLGLLLVVGTWFVRLLNS